MMIALTKKQRVVMCRKNALNAHARFLGATARKDKVLAREMKILSNYWAGCAESIRKEITSEMASV